MKNTKGFTLIELIVVIAILGVLALILVPNFMGYLEDSKKATAETNARNAYTMATSYAAKGNAEPDGSFTLKEVNDKVLLDYPTDPYKTIVTCEGAVLPGDGCTKVKNVQVTSSGHVVIFEKNKITIDGEAK
ncbi:MAG: type II secretion system protein [Erysipelotrichaceae bacterium]